MSNSLLGIPGNPYQYTPEQIITMMQSNTLCHDSNKLEYRVRTQEELETVAEGVNCTLWVRRPGELLIDLDGPKSMLEFYTRFRDELCIRKITTVGLPRMWISRSGFGAHAAVGLREEIGDAVAIGVEMALGSDWRRGVLSYVELAQGNDVTSALFKPKQAVYVPFSDLPRYVERIGKTVRPLSTPLTVEPVMEP